MTTSRANHLAILYDIGRTINSSLDPEEVLNLVMDKVVHVVRAERGFLMLSDERTGRLEFRVARNMDRQTIESTAFQVSRSITEGVAASGEPLLTTDALFDERFSSSASVVSYGLRSVMCTPLRSRGRITGVVYVDSRLQSGIFHQEDLDLLVAFADQAAIAIENARLYDTLRQQYEGMIQSLVEAIDARDRYTKRHSGRVTGYAMSIVAASSLPAKEAEALRHAAVLHDVGKIGVPEAILNKRGPLTDAEFARMKAHVLIGVDIVSPVASLADLIPLIRHHHELYDGSGYPDGVRGEAIPLGARILCVADSFDAMTTDRPHRPAKTVEEARAELRRCAGTQFDPQVVEAFLGKGEGAATGSTS
ncbi:MAG: HD domain-containing protein, partial [Chloroflexi bacterium]|nr:HD domain-containing protein [Chloroflexota bacterium]